jgi:transposase-like protein
MGKSAESKRSREEGSLSLKLAEVVRHDLREFVVQMGMAALLTMLEEDRTAICGARHARTEERRAYRHGTTPGELVFGGRRVQVDRPRARDKDGEVELPSWAQFIADDPLSERVLEQMLVGVSTRKYGRSLEPMPKEIKSRGTSKSAVSRRFIAKTQADADAWLSRGLDAIDLAVLMIDGMHIDEHVMLIAIGIDTGGTKHVLGLREGATENAVSCRELLADLQARGLRTDRRILAVLDGSKALAKAVRDVFGDRVRIQRCQAHKKRNILEQLPEKARPSVEMALRQAYGAKSHALALKLLKALHGRLAKEHPGAAASLAEGMEETITIKLFAHLPDWLARTLATTNAIENVVGSARALSKRVKRWRGGTMIVRWVATALIEAEKRFHRVRDHKGLVRLVADLRRDETIDVSSKVA